MDLHDHLIDYLRSHPGASAHDLAREFSTDAQDIDGVLRFLQDRPFIVTRYNQTHGKPMPGARAFATEREARAYAYTMRNARIPPSVEHLPAIANDTVLGNGQPEEAVPTTALPISLLPTQADEVESAREARATLARLKRGVPPFAGIRRVAVGMKDLEQQLNVLLHADASPRWFGLTGEYGEGKSFFRALASEDALQSGYAMAFFDVNRDEGALHQPQRHLAALLDTLQSPLPEFRHHHGIRELVRHWLAVTPNHLIRDTLERLMAISPSLKSVTDRDVLRYIVTGALSNASGTSESSPWVQRLLVLLGAHDLVRRSSYARFSAAFRLQVVLEWLKATGHKGMLLFVDEIDNVIRQISVMAHPACFRTLAWYCSSEALTSLRVIFAMTPEMALRLDRSSRSAFGRDLRQQQTVLPAECRAFDRWNHEAQQVDEQGWSACVPLRLPQRLDLFHRIATLHRTAWGASHGLSDDQLRTLARLPDFKTTRRWVRACVQLLDVLSQHTRIML